MNIYKLSKDGSEICKLAIPGDQDVPVVLGELAQGFTNRTANSTVEKMNSTTWRLVTIAPHRVTKTYYLTKEPTV